MSSDTAILQLGMIIVFMAFFSVIFIPELYQKIVFQQSSNLAELSMGLLLVSIPILAIVIGFSKIFTKGVR